MVELVCFELNHPPEKGGLGRYGHFVEFVKLKFPGCWEVMFNEWVEKQIRSLCDYNSIGWAGCAACGKTHVATLFAMVWWLVDPKNSAVILTSTSKQMIKRRQWAAFQYWVGKYKGKFPGHTVDSMTIHQAEPGDVKHSIGAYAVEQGEMKKAMEKIQGIHCRRILIIIDEATGTQPAVWEVCANLSSGAKRFQILAIGNPDSQFDPHGLHCEPKAGWNSITVDSDEWETKDGICIHFDGVKSPNVTEGKTKWEYLITIDQIETNKKKFGENSTTFWKYSRGFWCPEGSSQMVLTAQTCAKYCVQTDEPFHTTSQIIGAVDPAFEGDRCAVKFAKVGDRTDGTKFLKFFKTVIIRPQATSKEPVTYQISNGIIKACEDVGCLPHHFACDTTGNGIAVADALARDWSSSIIRVLFNSAASDIPLSNLDTRSAKDVCKNKVTELWFAFRSYVEADLIRGMDPDTINEFCKRKLFSDGVRSFVEPKKEMKARLQGESPDLADAAALVVEVARKLGFGTIKKKSGSSFKKAVQRNQQIYRSRHAKAA